MSALLIYLFGAIVVAEYDMTWCQQSARHAAIYGLLWPIVAAFFLILAPIIDDAD